MFVWCEADSDSNFELLGMAQHTQSPLWRDASELSVQIERAGQRFSRHHKYALGADLRSSIRLLFRAITLAARKDAIALHARREVILLAEPMQRDQRAARVITQIYRPPLEVTPMFRIALVLTATLLFTASANAQQVCPSGNPRNAPDSRYSVQADGTVRDLQTSLVWQRCSQGQAGSSCSGTASLTNWTQALVLANNSSFAGRSDWRLPSSKELQTLVEYGCSNRSINLNVFPNTPRNWFWSSTTSAAAASVAWIVNFDAGFLLVSAKDNAYHVRLVRGGQ